MGDLFPGELRSDENAMSAPARRRIVPARDEIAATFRWRLEDLLESAEAWETEFARVERLIAEIGAWRGRASEGPRALAELLAQEAQLGEALDRVYVWAHLRRDEDTREADAQARAQRAARLSTRAAEATSWIEPEILAIPRERLQAALESTELASRRHYLHDLLRMQEHRLSPREEEILAMAGDVTRVPRTAFGMLDDADLRFRPVRDEEGREVELTKGRYSKLLESADRRVRRDAWTSLTEGYENHRNVVAALLAGSVARDVFFARARRYRSSLEAALHAGNIPPEVYHRLIEAMAERRELLHRYTALRKRVLGVESLEVYDLYVPLGTSRAPSFGYDEARTMLLEGLAALGEEYGAALRAGFEGAWIDVYESRGKRSGAYSWGAYGRHPYVLLNWQGTLDHVFTLAHEMGHALHSHFTNTRQPYHAAHYPIFLAEVASTTNEALLMDHLLRTTANPGLKLALLNQAIDQIRGTVVTQVVFAEFEHRLHEMMERGEALTADSIGEVYREIFVRTLGPELSFPDRAAIGWARIPHFYTGYYVYQYATGYAAAIALSRRILGGGATERSDYLGFLSAGDSDYPIEILRRAGVDLTKPDAVQDTFDLFESLMDRLEEHLAAHGIAGAQSTRGEGELS
jgi:oligoendopeptidase F